MSLLKDLRYGARKLVRNPGFSAVAVLTLALGIGLTTTMFSIVYGAMMRGLPFPDGDRVVAVERNNPPRHIDQMGVTLHDFADYRAQARSFEGLAAYTGGTFNVSGNEKPERFDGSYMSANAFRLLRVQPLLGRTFRDGEDEPGAPAVVVLSHELWKHRFAGSRSGLGTTIRVNGEQAEVVGVMGPGFRFPNNQDLWVPLRRHLPASRVDEEQVQVFGRLKPGVDVDRATVELAGIAKRLAAAYPESNRDIGAHVKGFTETAVGKEPRALLLTMLLAVFLVLLIACANVANLLLSQAAQRAKEVGVRTALGASRRRIAMQFLTEPLAMAFAGAVLGTGLAWIGVRLFNNAIASTQPPFFIVIRIDAPILLFVLGITLFATLVSGVLPAIRASGANVNEVLKDESRGSSSFRGSWLSAVLVVFEIMLSVGLLVAAGLTTKSVTRLADMDFGVPTKTIFSARVGLPETQYRDSVAQIRFFNQLYPRLADIPGADAYTLTSNMPVLGAGSDPVQIQGKAYASERDYPESNRISTYPGYFSTFQVKVEGRDFGSQDTETSDPVAVVNQTFATKFFGRQSPIGRRIRFGGEKTTEPWRTIVGVVPDMWADGTDNEDPQAVYLPFAQAPQRYMSVAIRTRGDPGALTQAVRERVAALDPDLPIYFVKTLQGRIDEDTWFYRVFGAIFMIMGFVALFLAAIGLYGVMAFSVSRRTREMGVRMALGAQPGDVVRLIVRQGVIQLAIGLVLGLVVAYALGRLLKIILFQVQATDPLVYATTLGVLAAAGIFASLIPARRATRVDPLVALRYE